MLNIDTSRALKRPTQLHALVSAVEHADPADELDWIEWKTDVNLDNHVGQGTVARHILGLANREPDVASRTAGGHGYIVIGVEPGQCPGIAPVDPADLDPRIQQFLDEKAGPTWQPQWVDHSGARVLVVIVDPPQQGDPIHMLQKQFGKYQAGEIFVRRKGRTELRRPSDVQRLLTRQTVGSASSRLTVSLVNRNEEAPPTVTPLDASDEAIQPWLDDEEVDLLSALTEKADLPPNWTLEAAGPLGPLRRIVKDERSHDEYRDQVAKYIERARDSALRASIAHHVRSGVARVALALSNPTDHPYRDVRVMLHIPDDGVMAFTDYRHDQPDTDLPRRPRRWGPRVQERTQPFMPGPIATPIIRTPSPYIPTVTIDNSGSTRLSYLPVDLGPHETVPLDAVHLAINHAYAGTQLTGKWEARSTHASGLATGTIAIHVANDPVPAHALLAQDIDNQQ